MNRDDEISVLLQAEAVGLGCQNLPGVRVDELLQEFIVFRMQNKVLVSAYRAWVRRYQETLWIDAGGCRFITRHSGLVVPPVELPD